MCKILKYGRRKQFWEEKENVNINVSKESNKDIPFIE